MIKFTQEEITFLKNLEECRIATSHNDIPHVKPVSYIFKDGEIFVATDYETRMYKNILENPKVAISIDVYKSGNHKAVCVQGKAIVIEKGHEFLKIYEKFFEKFDWVRTEPWEENEAPFIKIIPTSKVSWGLF